jgi:hypothetical protein
MNTCKNLNCYRPVQYSYTDQKYYSQCPYHGLSHDKCLMPNCSNLTEYSITNKKFYPLCPYHADIKGPKCSVKKCPNLTMFSPTMGIFHSKCPDHGLNNKLNNKLSKIKMNDKCIKVDDDIEKTPLFKWITNTFKPLTIKEADSMQPTWENIIMAKNGWLSFWFNLTDIAKANDITTNYIISYLQKSKINLMHAELVREPKAIRFANNNCDMLYNKKIANWIHTYLNTYKIIY